MTFFQYKRDDSKLILVPTKCDLWDKEDDPPIDLISDENSDALCAEFHADSVLRTSSGTNDNERIVLTCGRNCPNPGTSTSSPPFYCCK